MARPSSDVQASPYLRLLVLGGPKSGKTTCTIATAPGPVYVINSDDQYSLRPAVRHSKQPFEWELCLGTDPQAIERVWHEVRTGVKEGRYKTVVWDTITKYSDRIVDVYAAATTNAKGEADGRRYWPLYRKHLINVIDRLFTLKAHVIVNAHYVEVSGATIEGQIDKVGAGVVPGLGGQARTDVPAMFQDVVFLDRKGSERYFVTASDGVWGPGCRGLSNVMSCKADIGELWKLMQADAAAPGLSGSGKKKEKV